MIRDFLSYDGDGVIECDLCIAGAGAAGIALAREFIGRRERVLVLESGGFEAEDATQNLYAGPNLGHPYFDLDAARARYFGGSTVHWGGFCTPYDPIDFTVRDWMPYSGWPITRADIEPYYPQANEMLDLGPFDYNPKGTPRGDALLPFSTEVLRHKLWRYSGPTNFGEKYRAELEAAENVEVLLHANLLEIDTDDQARTVTAFPIASLEGHRAKVRAKRYVLALGGIENPRLLLSSNRVIPAGLGNANDLVGRFFMEHPQITAAMVVIEREDWIEAYQTQTWDGQEVHVGLQPSPAVQEREHLLNSAIMFGPKLQARARSKGYHSLHKIKEDLGEGQIPEDFAYHLWQVITDIGGVIEGAWEKVDPKTYLVVQAEQSPNPDSRVTLIDERDALGMRRAALAWRFNPIDKRTIRTLAKSIGKELGRLGAGRLQLEEWLRDEKDDTTWTEYVVGVYHHIGTTRMADDPSRGVVDADCRLFGTDNFYIAGSSVFPTGGCANPTLTVVAMALRLAAHLKTRFT